jgi:UDP-N-acetylmuramate dehydrogenase
MRRDYKRWASGLIKGKVLFDAPMRRFTSMKVGGPADCLFFPKDADELKKVIRFARRKKIPFLILGKGTNLIVRDKGVGDG